MIHECVISPTHAAPVHAFLKKGVDIYTCPTCGCIMGDLEFVHDQYESATYYTLAFQDKSEVERQWGFRWRYVLRALKRYVKSAEQLRILDVGAGNGYFVFLARTECGWDADGLEISDAEAEYAREQFGVEFLRGRLEEVTARYNVVASFNVLEHVIEPVSLLRAMNKRLEDGGCLLLTTPNPSSIHRRISGLENWGMVDPPHHINLFTRRALEELLARTGFEMVEHETLSTYIKPIRNFDTENLLLRRAAFHALKAANLGSDHFVICRKGAHEAA
jgi:2-polyprenyl-3-methyl-5-hydroxy-6-metoxy-1,4-benzoquinol methylase